MPIITNRNQVLELYQEAERKKWVLPCFNSENLTTTEAILAATKEFGEQKGIPDPPIIIGITCQYAHRTQASYYTQTRKWDIGLKLFLEDLKILTSIGAPFEHVRVMIHLDHVQFDTDQELLFWDMEQFSSIMYDASRLPLEQNIALTREFVKQKGSQIVIEGACDEIVDAAGTDKSDLTSADKAEEYFTKTGVDLIVANLGTEHRASAKELKYYGDYARKIKTKIGTKLVLHGASSVSGEQIEHLINDGVCKVNIWTALERDSTPILFKDMMRNASKVVGGQAVQALKDEGYLREQCSSDTKASLDFFTTVYRQDIIFGAMKNIVRDYLELWYK